jgi:hypothetical protein
MKRLALAASAPQATNCALAARAGRGLAAERGVEKLRARRDRRSAPPEGGTPNGLRSSRDAKTLHFVPKFRRGVERRAGTMDVRADSLAAQKRYISSRNCAEPVAERGVENWRPRLGRRISPPEGGTTNGFRSARGAKTLHFVPKFAGRGTRRWNNRRAGGFARSAKTLQFVPKLRRGTQEAKALRLFRRCGARGSVRKCSKTPPPAPPQAASAPHVNRKERRERRDRKACGVVPDSSFLRSLRSLRFSDAPFGMHQNSPSSTASRQLGQRMPRMETNLVAARTARPFVQSA